MAREYKFEKKWLKLNLASDADESVFSEIFLDRDYLIADDFIRRAPRSIVDIGAHIGLFSMYARGLNDQVAIFVYEPEPGNFAALKEHFKVNDIQNVFPKNVAVAATDGQIVLHVHEDSHNHSILKISNPKSEIDTIDVPAVSMKTIFERDLTRHAIDFCDLMKMDCEGAEFEILESMQTDLFKKIGAFYLEYHEYVDGKKKEDLVRIFQKNGFKTKVIPSRYDKRLGFILAKS